MAIVENTAVGAIVTPLPAGSAGEPIADPFTTALLDLIGHTLKATFDARLANHEGFSGNDACPVANRYPVPPDDPRLADDDRTAPALFLWWERLGAPEQFTIVKYRTIRRLRGLYVWDFNKAKSEIAKRPSYGAYANAALSKLSQRGYHPTWTYDGAVAAGTPLTDAISAEDSIEWRYLGPIGRAGKRLSLDNPKGRSHSRRREGRTYPALEFEFEVTEYVGAWEESQGLIDAFLTVEHDDIVIVDGVDGDDERPL